ncbi:MAG: DUF4342 domain-containing protein [Peptococcaceae bacterium]|nr:DUF4342 domain-containing protein [Peptococcaceae bacterium]
MTELEMIDVLRQRMRLSYATAKKALDEADGDLVQALIRCERDSLEVGEQVKMRGKQGWESFKLGFSKAGKTKIRLKRGEKVLFTLPAPVGALGILGALASTQLAVVGLLGTGVALANKCSLEIDSDQPRPQYQDQDNSGFGDSKFADSKFGDI